MGLKTKVGRFSTRTTNGIQSVSDVGFRPDVVFFTLNELSAAGLAPNADFSFGAMTETEQVYHAVSHTPKNGGVAYANSRHDDSKVLGLITAGAIPSLGPQAELDSMTSNGFDLNWTLTDGTSRLVDYLAFGELSGSKIITIRAPAATGVQSNTGVGFTPDLILFFSNFQTSAPPVTVNEAGILYGHTAGPGIFLSRGTTFSTFAIPGTGNPYRVFEREICVHNVDETGTTIDRADYDSFDVDGFSLNWTNVDGNERYYTAVCLKGVFPIASINPIPTTPEIIDYISPFPFRAVITINNGGLFANRNGTPEIDSEFGFGFFDAGPSFQISKWFGFDGDNARQSVSDFAFENRDPNDGEIELRGNASAVTNTFARVEWNPVSASEGAFYVLGFDSNLPLEGILNAVSTMTGRLREDERGAGRGGRIIIPDGQGFGGRIQIPFGQGFGGKIEKT